MRLTEIIWFNKLRTKGHNLISLICQLKNLGVRMNGKKDVEPK
jgi:hypothetical protein